METIRCPPFQQGQKDISLSKQLTQSLAEPPIPDADGEHVKQLSTLEPAEEHDDTNDAERVERQLLAQHTHADL